MHVHNRKCRHRTTDNVHIATDYSYHYCNHVSFTNILLTCTVITQYNICDAYLQKVQYENKDQYSNLLLASILY